MTKPNHPTIRFEEQKNHMTTEDIFTTIDEINGDIRVMENEVIPDLEKTFAYLTDPDYDPADNPDHELRDENIDNVFWALISGERDLCTAKEKLKKLYRTIAQMELDGGTSSFLED